MRNPIYLDNNSTTPMDARVLEEMIPYYTHKFGNPSSRQHVYGWIAEDGIELALERIQSLLGFSETGDFIFTSGATESINLVLRGILDQYGTDKQIITTNTEHKAVLETLAELEKRGASVKYLSVNEKGLLDLNQLEDALKKDTLLVSVMMANNETGVIQPIQEMIRMTHDEGALFFSDATQAFGKIPLNLETIGMDFMACSAHKVYGPKGVGGLYIRKKSILKNKVRNLRIYPQIIGGGQQDNFRSGTLNVPGIVGFGKASEIAEKEMVNEHKNLSIWRDSLEEKLLQLPFSYRNGEVLSRLPHVTNLGFDYIRAEQLLSLIPEIAISTGAACSSSDPEPSHVLLGMGLTENQARSSIRIGIGRMNTAEDIRIASELIHDSIQKLQKENPLWELKEGGENERIKQKMQS